MIELLGVGVHDGNDGWWLRRVCARIHRGRLTAVVSTRPEERRALLDAVSGRVIPEEGRIWVGGLPVRREFLARLHARVRNIELTLRRHGRRSVLWHTVTAASMRRASFLGPLAFPRAAERQMAESLLVDLQLGDRAHVAAERLTPPEFVRLAAARVIVQNPEVIVAKDPDLLAGSEARWLLRTLSTVAHTRSLTALVSVASPAAARFYADRVIVIERASVAFNGPPEDLVDESVSRSATLTAGGG